jgi:hypothetical protein
MSKGVAGAAVVRAKSVDPVIARVLTVHMAVPVLLRVVERLSVTPT